MSVWPVVMCFVGMGGIPGVRCPGDVSCFLSLNQTAASSPVIHLGEKAFPHDSSVNA